MKRVLCFLLACCFVLLAACGTSGDPSSSQPAVQGRYVETDITPPEGAGMSFLAPDGTIVSYDIGLKNKYESADGGATWAQSPGPGAKNEHLATAYTATMLPDGTLVAFLENEGFFKILPDGSEAPFAVPPVDALIAEGKAPYVTHLSALSDSRLLVHYFTDGSAAANDPAASEEAPDAGGAAPSEAQPNPEDVPQGEDNSEPSNWSSDYQDNTLLLDSDTGDTVAEVVNDGFIAVTADNEHFYLLGYDGRIAAYSLQDGSPVANSKKNVSLGASEEMMGYMNAVMYASAQNGLYILSNGTLRQVDKDGHVQTLLDATAYAAGSPSATPRSLFVLQDGSVVVNTISTDGTSKLYKYTWDPDAAVDPAKTLKIWSLKDNALARAAISEFRRQHPDTTIQYEVALKEGTAMSAEDAVKNLNTQLLNGDGPDVIFLDGCPAQSYAQRGMLLNLDGKVDADDVYKPLLQSFKTSDGLYYLPAQFSLPVLTGSGDALANVKTYDDFVNLIVSGKDLPAPNSADTSDPFAGLPENERPALHFDSLREAYDLLWSACAPAVLKDNSLDTEQLRAFLSGLQQVSDKQRLATADESQGISMAVGSATSVETLPGSLVHYLMQQAGGAAYPLNSLSTASVAAEHADAATALFPGLAPGAWTPRSMAGVNAESKVPELATAFLQAMLSPEVQGTNYGGLPVTAAGMQAQMADLNKMREQEDKPPLALDMDNLIASLQSPAAGDEILTETVWRSAEALCKGETDLEGAVKTIEQELKNYLAERA